MININFDPRKPYKAVVYARMSDPRQNARSPDQQIAEINRRIEALGYPWTVVRIYRDDGVSGRLVQKRKAFRKMLGDLKTGAVEADLILVDTFQRFGRAKELAAIRDDLQDLHGVILLTANSNFADPNTPQGRALGLVDNFVASEENRVKSHNIGRGKKDTVNLKQWPGGSAPFGFQLSTVFKTENGRQVADYSLLVPHPEERHIVSFIFQEADRTGYGQTRLARHLNEHGGIPDKFKPFHPNTLARWLRSEIYIGVLVFGKLASDIVRDTSVRRRNPESEIQRVEDFCEAIVEPELFERVKQLFDARSQRHKQLHPSPKNGKLIAPLAPGLTLKFLLSGLVYCSDCGQRMTISSSGEYTTQCGEKRRYVYYYCSASLSGRCPNRKHIPEAWLRQTVIGKLRDRLFPTC